MEYAIDKYGNLVHQSVAEKNNFFRCPDCLEQTHLRRGPKIECFAHGIINDRTPLQRICPEYHEKGTYKKVENEVDIVYIDNGGIPLYLCNNGSRFQLRAYFPRISEASYNYLKEIGARIHVNPDSGSQIHRRTYPIEYLDYYPVDTIEKWIDITCEPPVTRKDVQRKWLWGIRGVDIERDIYYANKDGGYRVALKADIRVGKPYRIMFKNISPNIEGISFQKVGQIRLKKGLINKDIAVYEMVIKEYTEKARAFIGEKGYRLVEKSNDLLPLWPPAAFKGNEIIFDKREAVFLHIDHSKRGRLYYTGNDNLFEVRYDIGTKEIIPLQISHDKSMIISNIDNGASNYEIKYYTSYSPSLIHKKELIPVTIIEDTNGKEIDINSNNFILPKDRKLYIDVNLPFCALVSQANYIMSSSCMSFENIDYYRDLIIDCRGFGRKVYTYKREKFEGEVFNNINWDLEYLKLYGCCGPTINTGWQYARLLNMLSQDISSGHRQLYRLLETWTKTNSIPVSAIKYLNRMLEYLGGSADGKEI